MKYFITAMMIALTSSVSAQFYIYGYVQVPEDKIQEYIENEEEYFSRYIHNNLYLHYFLKGNNVQHMFFDAFYQTDLGHHHNYEMRTDGVATEHKFLEVTKDIYKSISFKNFMIDYRSGIGKASDRRYDFKQGLFSKDNSHPSENAHQLWAEELFKDLKGKINA